VASEAALPAGLTCRLRVKSTTDTNFPQHCIVLRQCTFYVSVLCPDALVAVSLVL